jgi:hypothetical protein
MGTDNIKIFNKIKILTILIWLIYPVIYYCKLNIHLPKYDTKNVEVKKSFNQQNGISLIGGSNVVMGLSAEIISNNSFKCHNFGISSEGGDFAEYLNFLGNRISSSDIIVYSPILIWSEQPPEYNSTFFKSFNIIPPYSIISQIKGAFYSKSSDIIRYNSYGDQVGYICTNAFSSYSMDYRKFAENNIIIVEELIKRVKILKKIAKTDKVFVRIPPIYTDESRKKLIGENMKFRIKSLREQGIIVVCDNTCSSDKSLFCDNIHPNDKGRKIFSMELKDALIKIQ